MTGSSGTDVIEEHRIATPRGMLYAKSWHPREDARDVPVVLFHDSLGCVELWRDFPAALCEATRRRVIAYDRLGFGRSDPRDDVLPPRFVADEALFAMPVLCEQLSVASYVAFGHSVGGGMAIACAAAFPREVAALVTESAQTFVEERTLAGIRAAKALFAQDAQLSRLAKYHGAKARWVLDAWTETWLAPEFATWNLDAELARVRCPVLALHGDRDEYGSIAHPQRIGARVPGGAEIEILADGGHVPHRERADVVLARVVRFLDGETARRS